MTVAAVKMQLQMVGFLQMVGPGHSSICAEAERQQFFDPEVQSTILTPAAAAASCQPSHTSHHHERQVTSPATSCSLLLSTDASGALHQLASTL
jgi:hypothetical protein